MQNFFGAIWAWISAAIRNVTTLVVRDTSGQVVGSTISRVNKIIWAVVTWIIILLLFVTIEYALYHFNDAINLGRWLPALSPKLKPFYAPLLGLIVILVGVVLYFLFVSWDAETEASPFPDIDAAWKSAMDAVHQAGIQAHQVSLFLVLGRPESAEVNMFDGSGTKWVVKHAPPDPTAPIHVYAEKESSPKSAFPGAIYVTCRGASVLGKLAGILARDETVLPPAALADDSLENADATVGAVDRDAIKAKEIIAASLGREATVLEKRKAYRAERGKPLGNDLMADNEEVTRLKARLAHLCRLIARERKSECAANGILLLIPLAGTDTIGEAQLTAQAALEDLSTVRTEMRIDCPVVTMLVDLEDLPGFSEFLSLQRPKELGSRRGGSFPMSTRMSTEELRRQLRASLSWICTTYMQDSVYSVYQTETEANKEVSPLFLRNSRLTLLLTELNERTEAVCDIVMSSIMPENAPMFRYSGFYFAATGAVGVQGFVGGVLQKMVKEQASVTWTQAALDADAESHKLAGTYATATFAMLAFTGVLVAGTAYYFLR